MYLLSLFGLVAMTMGCGNEQANNASSENDPTTENEPVMKEPVYEIAVRKVKDGQQEAFTKARSLFINTLKEQEGVQADREFASFYALPQPDERPVFIGMTEWASMDAAGAAGAQLMNTETAQNFFNTFDFKAYVMVKPSEGEGFDLSTLAAQDGQVLELAVRRVKAGQEAAFDTYRKQFVALLDGAEGVLGSYEFEVVGGQHTERLAVGMSVYASQEAFQAIAGGPIMQNEVTQQYFSTFEPVALQYAVSATNQ